MRGGLHAGHDAKEVAAPNFGEIFVREALGLQTTRELNELGGIGQSRNSPIAVEIGADADVIDAGHRDHVEEMAERVVNGCVFVVGAQEAGVEGALRHTAVCGERPQLVVRKVAG